jgi:ribosomal-protein-alanine N-acetyltransferase
MRLDDIPEVSAVDRRSFSTPWPASAYRREVTHADKNLYIVLRRVGEDALTVPDPKGGLPGGFLSTLLPFFKDGAKPPPEPVVGYAGLWIVGDEAHVTTIAVLPELRGQGLGELLLVTILEHARQHGAHWVTLEVRVSNRSAQALYRKYTFKDSGYRRRYYSDDGEDALVMWTDRVDTPEFGGRFEELKQALHERLGEAVLEVSR